MANMDLIPILAADAKLIPLINANMENANTLQNTWTAILVCIKNIPGLAARIPAASKKAYDAQFKSAKTSSKATALEKAADESIEYLPFSEIKRLVFAKFPEWSRQRLIIEFYEQVPWRDDLGNLKIISKPSEATDIFQNYLVWPNAKPGEVGPANVKTKIILRAYKTAENYDTSYNAELPPIIATYLHNMKKELGDFVIAKDDGKIYANGGSLSSQIGNMLVSAGVKEKSDGLGAVLYLRHVGITERLAQVKTDKDRIKLAELVMHSVGMSPLYKRKIKNMPDYVELVKSGEIGPKK